MRIEVPVQGVRGFRGSLFVSLNVSVVGDLVGEVAIAQQQPVTIHGVEFVSAMFPLVYKGGMFDSILHTLPMYLRRADWEDVSAAAAKTVGKALQYVLDQLNDADSPAGRQVGTVLAARTETAATVEVLRLERQLAELDQQRARLSDQLHGHRLLQDTLAGVGDVSRGTFDTVAGLAAGLLADGMPVQEAWAVAWTLGGGA